jgi:hypothetical protein
MIKKIFQKRRAKFAIAMLLLFGGVLIGKMGMFNLSQNIFHQPVASADVPVDGGIGEGGSCGNSGGGGGGQGSGGGEGG